MKTKEQKRIFIVGCARSGTTLIQSMLASHPNLTSFTESHFYSQAFLSRPQLPFPPYNLARPRLPCGKIPFFSRNIFRKDFRKRVPEFLAENGFSEDDIDFHFPKYLSWFPPFYTMISREFLKILDDITEKRGAHGWIEKTPHHLYYIPIINYTCPNAKFIHIIRDGRDNVASLFRTSRKYWKPKPLDVCIKQWNRSIKTTRRWASRSGNFIILYEELVAHPEPVLRTLCKKLDLPWSRSVLRYKDSTQRIVTENEPWKSGVNRPLRLTKRYLSTFDKDQQEYVVSKLNMQTYNMLREKYGRLDK